MAALRPLVIGLHPAVRNSEPEIKYVLRTLLRVGGFAYEFRRAPSDSSAASVDVYYGPHCPTVTANVTIDWCGRSFDEARRLEPIRLDIAFDECFLAFDSNHGPAMREEGGRLRFANDIIFACYWLLSGAREPYYRRDRRDNMDLQGSFFFEQNLAAKPLVSQYGALLRKHFQHRDPLGLPWVTLQGRAAVALTHDVDYPQMIRWIESLRLLRQRGLRALGSIKGVVSGNNHFWKFAEWVEFAQGLGTSPSFYFMGRQGSLRQYATGTPDVFYDVRRPEFRRLFEYLHKQGCEVGLHPSYQAYRSLRQLIQEKTTLEDAAGIDVAGGRHHYWHLDPLAPHETLSKHEEAGLFYDSSLAFEFYPGYRRGVCHPYRPYHPQQRRELNLVELPPAWMDDHFDRRLTRNRITDPDTYADGLARQAQSTGGVVVVDYHVRGMNHDFYPRYGRWLTDWVRNRMGSSIAFRRPLELARDYVRYEAALEENSCDRTL